MELTEEEKQTLQEAGRILRRMNTDKQRKASAANGKRGGRPQKPLAEMPCTCGRSDAEGHPTSCPRGLAIRRRAKSASTQLP